MDALLSLDLSAPGATVYAEGWQSWSFTSPLPAGSAPWSPRSANAAVMACQDGVRPKPGLFTGAGLLAVSPAEGAPVEVFGALDAKARLTRVELSVDGDGDLRGLVSADGPVTHVSDTGPGGLQGALGRFADGFSRSAGVGPLRAVPPVWCSWYQYFDEVTAADIESNLGAMDELNVPAAVVQIDDGWETAAGDWSSISPRFGDLGRLTDQIVSSGRQAGIWLAPFVAGRHSEVLRRQPGWALLREDGEAPVEAGHGINDDLIALDTTHPGVRQYLADLLGHCVGQGFSYFKLDFLYAGALPGRRHQGGTGLEAYRDALTLARHALGPGPLLLGCGAPLLPSVGLVDAMRVGPDTASTWYPGPEGPAGEPSEPSQWGATVTSTARAWQQGRFWVNDADCLLARPGVEGREAWAATVEHFSALRASSDDLRALDDWGLEVTRRLLVPSSTVPFGP